MILNVIVSTLLFVFLLWVGQILMFINIILYWLVPCFIIGMWISKFFIQENCKTLEIKDFVFALFVTFLGIGILTYQQTSFSIGSICYLYVCVFIANTMFASSIRYKSLM